KLLLFFVVLITSYACDSNRVYDEYKSIDISGWDKNQIIAFEIETNDTIHPHELFLQIRNTEAFKYSNLFLITDFIIPNGTHQRDTLEFAMTDRFGNWLGSGFTDIKENKLYYKEAFVFPRSGTYTIRVQQAMRKRDEVQGIQKLQGISEVGFRVEKTNKE
ncbi:MAG: gliding motility lipoprotein GldH, partial [Flavicella sp.]